MSALTFVPAATGGWVAVASGSDLVLLEPVAAGRVDRAWEAVGSPGAFESVIRLVAEDGFDTLPQFALVEWVGDHVRAVVRGEVTLEVDDADGSHRQDGRGVSTWTERGFDGVTAVRLIVAGATALDGVGALPLASGAAIVASCTLTAEADVDDHTVVVERPRRAPAPPVTEPVEAPAPVAEPTPVAEPATPVAELVEAPAPVDTLSGDTLSHPVSEQAASPSPAVEPAPAADTEIDTAADLAAPATTPDDALSGDTVLVPRKRGAVTTAAPAAAPVEVPAPVEAPAPQPEPYVPTPFTRTPTAPTPVSDPEMLGDHDGMTIVGSAIPKGRQPRPVRQPSAAASAPAPVLVLPGGERASFDQPIVVGRAPSANQVSGAELPRLVTVGGSDQDISRTHVRFALEGDSVVVTDLHSRNGTLVVLPGKPPQKLRAGEPTTVVVDTVVDLGGGITFTVSSG